MASASMGMHARIVPTKEPSWRVAHQRNLSNKFRHRLEQTYTHKNNLYLKEADIHFAVSSIDTGGATDALIKNNG